MELLFVLKTNINISTESQNCAKVQVPDKISVLDGKLPGDKSATLIALSSIRKRIDVSNLVMRK